jgi:hemolysin III
MRKKGKSYIKMALNIPLSQYSIREELANSITHGIGVILAIGALVVLDVFAAKFGDAWHVISCSIFGATLIILYTSSTLYHSIPFRRAKMLLRIIDHSAIFLLIAGTYTPFTLVSLRGPWGWSLFGAVWAIALLGVVFQVFLLRRWPLFSVGIYVGMGLLILIALKPLFAALPPIGLRLLVAGGMAYIFGLIFYGWNRLPYSHAVWHLFVLAGSALHFFAVLFSVIPWTSCDISSGRPCFPKSDLSVLYQGQKTDTLFDLSETCPLAYVAQGEFRVNDPGS